MELSVMQPQCDPARQGFCVTGSSNEISCCTKKVRPWTRDGPY